MSDAESQHSLPPVANLGGGLWAIPVPLPLTSLRYVTVYALEARDGVYLVDAGWNTDGALQALNGGLAVAGMDMKDVRGVMVTHLHPDHYGLAGRVRAGSGAWVALHPADAAMLDDPRLTGERLLPEARLDYLRAGAPPEEVDLLGSPAMPLRGLAYAVTPDVLIEDGDRPEVPGWDLTAIWTPGHSPGHLCFYAPEAAVMMTGDHVLPRITPNIAAHVGTGNDPLGDYLKSLDKIATYGDDLLVLPAHEHRFYGLGRRATEIRQHHEQRLTEVLALVEGGAETAWLVAAALTWSRPWAEADAGMRRAAVSEAQSHLLTLGNRGRLREAPTEGPVRWLPVSVIPAG